MYDSLTGYQRVHAIQTAITKSTVVDHVICPIWTSVIGNDFLTNLSEGTNIFGKLPEVEGAC